MEKEKSAFISILTTEDYVTGLKVMYHSLRRFTDREVVVLVNEDISGLIVQELSSLGMLVVRVSDIEVQQGIISEKMQNDRWCYTLFKLRVFGMTDYDKLVYLDSDMLICGNPDTLFFCEDMSAVPDAEFFPEYSRGGINAGIFVFRPSKELEQQLIGMIPEVAEKMEIFGDQDVINAYYASWEEEKDKHLEVKYNACFYQLDEYEDVDPLVVHFILASKPWMWTTGQIIMKCAKWIFQRKKKQYKYFKEYAKVLKNVR